MENKPTKATHNHPTDKKKKIFFAIFDNTY